MNRLAAVTAAAALGVVATPALAQAAPNGAASEGNQCLTPFGGAAGGELLDLNALFDRTEQFIHPRWCPEVDAGEWWIVGRGCLALWTTNSEHANYPAGYVPRAATPMEDFLSKVTVKVVVDPGTDQERIYLHRYTKDPSIADVRLERELGGSADLPIASLLPVNPPQPIGTHVAEVYVVMSADHWDGLGTDPGFNLFPAGEHLITANNRFETVPRSERS